MNSIQRQACEAQGEKELTRATNALSVEALRAILTQTLKAMIFEGMSAETLALTINIQPFEAERIIRMFEGL